MAVAVKLSACGFH